MRSTAGRMILVLVAVAFGYGVSGGDLEPPGAPAPTMKPLNEVEPRTPIRAADLPLTISSSGSYYAVEDLITAGGGIRVSVDNVTIDLMGFSLVGGTLEGIRNIGAVKNVMIQNGTISGWAASGINFFDSSNIHVRNLNVADNGALGMWLGNNSIVTSCVATGNASDGIAVTDNSVITYSSSFDNGARGFDTRFGSKIAHSVAQGNGSWGFNLFEGSSASDCTARENTGDGFKLTRGQIHSCISTDNGGIGFNSVSGPSRIVDSMAQRNDGDGIRVASNDYVGNNACANNGSAAGGGGNAAGVHATGTRNRIEGNTVHSNDRGIDVDSIENVVTKNVAQINGVDYDIVVGNFVAPITSDLSTAGPWDNFED